ncbi:DUF5011 domain-containing protein [Lutispora saccharofermentans]|uniref:DUF5011 domain-containing protein n=1 Tax=Lutispora saccharofermentans TaxID=3024236 RepID=A0ABT1NJ28_9FIRM|nr:DUF5011 domain-containing protein [Lutispora saccharofermentans]MCQ1530301.1 DUF5011 domain-containing protein [Lutispora saccharofermentans]
MNSAKMKPILAFMLIMIMYMSFSSITVYGGYQWYLLNDDGGSPGSWTNLNDEVARAASLKNGPSGGNPGYFYYFKNDEDGTREMADAEIARTVNLNEEQKMLCNLGQLTINFSVDYFGWDDSNGDNDRFKVRLYKNGTALIHDSGYYIGNKSWETLRKTGIILPAGTTSIKVDIYADRDGGSDLDVYLDNIKVWVSDETSPAMTGAAVDGIRDYNGNAVPLKKDEDTGEYLDNWVNTSDTIYGSVKYNEPVTISMSTFLMTNILHRDGSMLLGDIPGSTSPKYSHEYQIPLAGADRLGEGSGTVKFFYNPGEAGPFSIPVGDIGGNDARYIEKPNIEKYKLKLDNAVPEIISPAWPYDSYKTYEPDRTSVDIIVREENRGAEQSPLTLIYHWEYRDISGIKITGPEKKMLISNTVIPVEDDTYTTYTVKIDIPNGSGIPPYQEFTLYAEVNDEARNVYGNNYICFGVNQNDATPPAITWDKSIHGDGTAVDLNEEEDTLYAASRTVSFSAEDLESGIKEVKYLWTRETYKEGTDVINKAVLPAEDGKYHIQGTSFDAPLEGVYYLNILASNGTAAESISSKAFYFDNEGPRASGEIIYIDEKPVSAQYHIEDRALQGKFLYALLTMDMGTWDYEPVTEPDISGGIKDDGMWRALELDSMEGTASIDGVLGGISDTGYYKLIARFYDEYYNWTQIENQISFDFDPPIIKVKDLGEPEVFQKDHEVSIEIIDMSYVDLRSDDFSVNWVDATGVERIPASFENLQSIIIRGSDALNGRYHLNIKAKDFAGNSTDKTVFEDGNPAEFCFDNSPPTVDITYDKEIAQNIFKFSYSELKDAYTDVALFKYGISASPDNEPSEWIDIGIASNQGEVTYPAAEGVWYLHIMLQDTLGNEQITCLTEPLRIDLTRPSGSIAFGSGYTNKLNVPLQLRIDELQTIAGKTFKTILSDDRTMLEDEAIEAIQPADWKDITYEDGLAICNWALADKEDGEQRVFARFMDGVGNISDIYEASIILDRTAPTGEVAYDITGPTAGSVIASLTMNDNYNAALLNNDGISSYVFNRNGEFEFVIADSAGNKAHIKAVVNNIDRESPKAYVTYSHPRDIWTNESITAALHLEDINGYTILSEGGFTHTFDENGEFLFRFEDTLGNSGSIKAEVKNIDKEAPEGSIIYAGGDTAPITVYLDAHEPVEVTNNGGSFRYVFDENGEFTFEFQDKAGNTGTAVASVYTITSPESYMNVMYGDSGGLTNENIRAEFTPNPASACITSPTAEGDSLDTYTYRFIDNGDHSVSIRVFSEEGNTRTVTGSVYNIDRIPPEAYVYLSTEEPTNRDVTAILLTHDDRGRNVKILNNGGGSEYVFNENGTFTFEFMDEAGNIGYEEVTVSNIDKSAPEAGIRYYTDELKPNKVFAEIYFPEKGEEVEILNNNGLDTFEFVENGTFTFLYSDKAGNTGEITARVSNLSDGVPAGTIEYYIGETKIYDPDEMMINKSVTAKLVLAEEGGPYTIVNNGGSSSYTFEQNGEFTFVYEDGNFNRGLAAAKVSTIDKEAPELRIVADTLRPTRNNVIITVSYSDNTGIAKVRHNMEPESIISSEAGFDYICTENKIIEVAVVDTAGNETVKAFDVNYIDRKKPTAEIAYTPLTGTNGDVKAVLIMNEPGRILTNSGKTEYIFTQNGEFVFEFEDYAGNKGSKTAAVTWIDKTPPAVSLEYSNGEMTNKPVEVILRAEEGSVIINNGGSAKRAFYRNGEFTFRVMDDAGNIAEIKAEVKNIDADKPVITLKGSPYTTIFQDEAYIEPGYTAVDNIDGDISAQVIVKGSVDTGIPGIYILRYKVSDRVGNSGEEIRTVKVLSPGEIVLLLNDEVAEGESVILNDLDVKVSALGSEGSLKLKWEKGKRTQAYFKTGGYTVAPGETVRLEAFNWYTFFLQDRERRTKTIQVYVNQ